MPAQTREARARRVHRRRFTLVVSALAFMIVATAASSHSGNQAVAAAPANTTSTSPELPIGLSSATYRAELQDQLSGSAADEPIAVLTLHYDAESGTLSYLLEVTVELANPSVAAICQGPPGTNGSTVITLFAGPTLTGPFSGVLAKGVVKDGDLVGPLRYSAPEDLVRLVQEGRAYATIGTADLPIDAVRGQIGLAPSASSSPEPPSMSGTGGD